MKGDFFKLFFFSYKQSQPPHLTKTSPQCYSMAFLPLLAAARGSGSGKETPGTPILHQRGCGGPRDPPTFFLEVKKEAAWTMLGRVCPGGGKKEEKGKG